MTPYYEHGGITLYHGDNRQILAQLPHIDLLLTDPPYGIGEARRGPRQAKFRNKRTPLRNGGSKGQTVRCRDYGVADWDDTSPSPWVFAMLREMTTYQIIFGGNYFGLPASSCWLVWDKVNGQTDFADCELAWTNLPKAVRRIHWRWNGLLHETMGTYKEQRIHPTQKPLGVMKWALSQAPNVKTVLYPYAGSGTTLIACKQAGLSAIGIEQEEKYCEATAKRLQQGVMTFDEP